MGILIKISELQNKKRQWTSIAISVLITGLLTIWGIYGIGEYGITIFILTPFFLGISPVIIFGYKNNIELIKSRELGFISLTIFMLCLLLLAIEGVICITMAFPIGLVFTWLGILVGYHIVKKEWKWSNNDRF